MKFPNISSIVRNVFFEYGIARVAAQQNILNITAFARQIQPVVEERARKPVKINAIVRALTRYFDAYWLEEHLEATMQLQSIKVQKNRVKLTVNRKNMDRHSACMLLVAHLVANRVPILELKCSYPEFTVIVPESRVGDVFSALKVFLKEKPKQFLASQSRLSKLPPTQSPSHLPLVSSAASA